LINFIKLATALIAHPVPKPPAFLIVNLNCFPKFVKLFFYIDLANSF